MNLFAESLADYLKAEWDNTLKTADGSKEARFILQSFDSENTFELFTALEDHRLKLSQRHRLECHFRVATKLWEAWGGKDAVEAAKLDRKMTRLGGIGTDGKRMWIDEEDRLTWYRNRTRPEDMDGLVVVLAGFEHATDQGGLANFHRVDERRIWQQAMGQTFEGWIRRLGASYAWEVTDSEVGRFDEVLKQLFQLSSWQLARMAEYMEMVANRCRDSKNLWSFVERFYWHLPFWGIPPLNPSGKGENVGKKGALLLKNAVAFIAHQKLKTPSEQRKAWDKLTKSFAQGDLNLPDPIPDNDQPYQNLEEFKATLWEFIFKADAKAKAKLMEADLVPVLTALKLREKKPVRPPKVTKLTGMSLEIMLRAVWETLRAFRQERMGNRAFFEVLTRVRVVVAHFKHDLADDEESGQDGVEVARALLQGCLGGLDKIFEQIGWHLPIDADQARLPCELWEKPVPITLDTGDVRFGTGRARPHMVLRIELAYTDNAYVLPSNDDDDEPEENGAEMEPGTKRFQRLFRWEFGPTQPERVRYQCAKAVLERWPETAPDSWMLPTFHLPSEKTTALYFAADEDEANRLIGQSLTELRLANLLKNYATEVDPAFKGLVGDLAATYRHWLRRYVELGYYSADDGHFLKLSHAYEELVKAVLDGKRLGSAELLRRLYKVFLLIDDKSQPQDEYLRCAVAWGISLPVMELDHYRICFLRNSFPEIADELALGGEGKGWFDRLSKLVEIHRPLAGLVANIQKTVSAEIKSFGLLHYLGERPSTDKSLAVQTLLREEESDDDEDIADSVRDSEESGVVLQVLKDYQEFYPFAQDGLRILALHVEELATVLSGVHRFLRDYLEKSNPEFPHFHCTVMVYTTAASPMVMENRLATWREAVLESCNERNRPLLLTVGHRYAPDQGRMCDLLRRETRLYDVAFLFHFLEGKLAGGIDEAAPFQYDFNHNAANIGPFPVCEYPRPILADKLFERQTLLSNRRLRLQARHADLSARLRQPQNSHADHVIYGIIDYEPWREVVDGLHRKAQWVACIDPFVDKNLLCGAGSQEQRKIVGFASGLGDYGELNLTLSTDQDTLQRLTDLVRGQLSEFLPSQQSGPLDLIASQVVGEAEEIIGLSSLHAVAGQGQKVREVVGFAAIRRALAAPSALMWQLLPVDALSHWFANSETGYRRPDLLRLALTLRGEGEPPLIQAVVIECKLAQQSSAHLLKATDQVCAGLSHLSQLFVPNCADGGRMRFDRRYWWAQLQRAITTRSLVNLPDSERRRLDRALESLAEGYYEITWQGAIFTFWTDDPGTDPVLSPVSLPAQTLATPFQAPAGFTLWHLALGYTGLTQLFTQAKPRALLDLSEKPAITVGVVDQDEAATSVPPVRQEPTINPVPAISAVTLPQTQPPQVETSDNAQSEAHSGITPASPLIEGTPPVNLPTVPVPERLLIGTRSNGEPVYWHYGHPDLNNRHLLIFGASGSGKTYGIQCLLAEMARQQLHSLIIDYTDGFLPEHTEALFQEIAKPLDHYVGTDKLPLNPLRRQKKRVGEENAYQVAKRVASIFASVFETMGDQQYSALVRVLQAGIDAGGSFTLADILPRLREDGPNGESLANKLEPLIMDQPFREDNADSAWGQMLSDGNHWVQILQLNDFDRETQKMVTEFALWDLYDYSRNSGNKNRPIPVVLDEIQNLDHSSDSPIDKMLREGRKFGLSLILATQTTSQFDQEQRDRLFQAGHKLFFKPANTEIDRFATLLSQTTGISKADWHQRLGKLQKGECWSLGPIRTSSGALKEEAVLVSVTALEKRQLAG